MVNEINSTYTTCIPTVLTIRRIRASGDLSVDIGGFGRCGETEGGTSSHKKEGQVREAHFD